MGFRLRISAGTNATLALISNIHEYAASRIETFGFATSLAHGVTILAGIVVEYEGVADFPMMRFPQQSWQNSEERQVMIDSFLGDGAHPFDTADLDAKEMPPGTILISFKNGP
ncbi:hypothetical protein FHT78_005865 [Rhizobium sp. BK196]|uniref:hypothetical protein n=1 Tax=Rhizobium sp. BK196 TaxID=2587073 RepID=UPI00160BE67F|nr:hypothetical protein [Rhizobium sp. BK196]MBB3314058.1 hypothetical protein [Rhizobium sp. BK196]